MARRRGLKPAEELDVSGMTPQTISRFLSYIGEPDANGCWPWEGHLDGNGYGQFWLPGASMSVGAHRVAHALFKGIIPRLRHVHHLSQCTRHDCVNPAHLAIRTHAANSKDGGRRRHQPVQQAIPF